MVKNDHHNFLNSNSLFCQTTLIQKTKIFNCFNIIEYKENQQTLTFEKQDAMNLMDFCL